MKCFIVTYYKFNNYGTRLQNYALLKTLESLGVEVNTIYLNDKKSLKIKVKDLMKILVLHLPILTRNQKVRINEKNKKKEFDKFNRELNFKYMDTEELEQHDYSNTIIIAGSDQIWSPNHLNHFPSDRKLFFLNFVPRGKRFAYAPSFGVSEIPENLKEMYTNVFDDFNLISVREDQGKEILSSFTKQEITVVPDPVFLLSMNEWSQLLGFSKGEENNSKYVLVYFLGYPEDSTFENISKYAEKNKCKIINIAGNYFTKTGVNLSPNEFVKCIANATVVFTDSFHACVFSIIMNTPFFVYERNDVKQFSRIETLLSNFNCEDRKISNKSFDKVYRNISTSYATNTAKLEFERNRGRDFLSKLLERGFKNEQ